MPDTTDTTKAEPVGYLELPPVVALDAIARRLRDGGMTPVVALLTAALIAVDDVHQAIDGYPEHDWDWPMEDWLLDYSQNVGRTLKAAQRALGASLVHYHTAAARRALLAAPSAREGGDHA